MRQSRDIFLDDTGHPRILRGVNVFSGSPLLAELAVRCGFEAVWIEMEHGASDFSDVERLCVAVEVGGGVPVVRVPDGQRMHVLRSLEVGAGIVMVPMVSTADQARQIVTFGKFPPLGQRGYNTRSRGLGFGLTDCATSFAEANARTHLFAQIETLEAVQNLDAICAVEGLSGIFIGPGDLSAGMGCPGDFENPRLNETVQDCIRRARGAGRHAGILVRPGRLLDTALEAGADLVICGGDVMDLSASWQKLLATARGGSVPA